MFKNVSCFLGHLVYIENNMFLIIVHLIMKNSIQAQIHQLHNQFNLILITMAKLYSISTLSQDKYM